MSHTASTSSSSSSSSSATLGHAREKGRVKSEEWREEREKSEARKKREGKIGRTPAGENGGAQCRSRWLESSDLD
eukprot:946798-Rhodomonas_salina.1